MRLTHLAVALSLSTSGAIGQTLLGETLGTARVDAKPSQTISSQALVGATDLIFPHLAAGGGWETTLVLVNMGVVPITVNGKFFSQTGDPMTVTYRVMPTGGAITSSSYQAPVYPGESFRLLIYGGSAIQVGWCELNYDTGQTRLGGYAIFRNSIPGLTDFEASVPLSRYDDTRFFFPFDNLSGVSTSMAIVNSEANIPSEATLTFRDAKGVVIMTDKITIGPRQQTAFTLPDKYPALKDRVGSVFVQGDGPRLSALGFRFNGGKGAFATIPVMNWVGMF